VPTDLAANTVPDDKIKENADISNIFVKIEDEGERNSTDYFVFDCNEDKEEEDKEYIEVYYKIEPEGLDITSVELIVEDEEGEEVYTKELDEDEMDKKTVKWEGKDKDGNLLLPDKYKEKIVITLEGEGAEGEKNKVESDEHDLGVVPRIEGVVLVSKLGGPDIPDDRNGKVLEYSDVLYIYNVVKCKVREGKDGFEYYLGYEGDDFPSSVEIKGTMRTLKKWDNEIYGDLIFNWEGLLPNFTHSLGEGNDPNARDYYFYTNVDQSGHWLGSNGWYANRYPEEADGCDIIEYKVRSDHGTGWQGSLMGPEGTIRFVTNVNYVEEDIKMRPPLYAAGKPNNNSMSGLIYEKGVPFYFICLRIRSFISL